MSDSSSSSSPRTSRLTPESSNDDGPSVYGDDVAAGALLGTADDDAYELREGVSVSQAHHDFVYTTEEERAVVRKFDRRLVLFVALLYMLSFLDRSNIGNAYIAGLDHDLLHNNNNNNNNNNHNNSTTTQKDASDGGDYYEWALSSFYVAYIAFEWMALLWNRIPAHVYVSAIVLSWGVVASLQAIATSYPVLIFLRFLLGIGEAGFTGIPVYLSFFFRREELALRTAIFISAAPLATSFASSLAWLIVKLGDDGPIAPWRLLFLVEGFPAVLVSTVAWRVIPDSPDCASYLTRREKKIARHRLLYPHHREDEGFRGRSEKAASAASRRRGWCRGTLDVLRDPVPWTTAVIFLLTNMAYSSLPVFLPAILTQMGHTALASQALAAPPYLVSFFAVLAVAKASDALQSRAYLIAASALLSALGYAFLALGHRLNDLLGLQPGGRGLNMARYLAIYPAAAGFFCVVVLTIAWNVNSARSSGHKGGGFALMQVVGQCGPLVGTRLYPSSDGPWFSRGMGVCAVAMFGVAGLALGLRAYMTKVNRRLDWEGEEGQVEEEEEGLVRGGRSAHREEDDDGFRYIL